MRNVKKWVTGLCVCVKSELIHGLCLYLVTLILVPIPTIKTANDYGEINLWELSSFKETDFSQIEVEIEPNEVQEVTLENTINYPDGIYYVAQCVEAEAGNQGYMGKVYVADVIYNRYYNRGYEFLTDVINEPGQFECVSNGSINSVEPTAETIFIVQEEWLEQTNTQIMYFKTDGYHEFAQPCFKERDHYFSK